MLHFDPRSVGMWDVERVYLIQCFHFFQSHFKLVAKSDAKNVFSSKTPVPQPDFVRKENWKKKFQLETMQTITAIWVLVIQK